MAETKIDRGSCRFIAGPSPDGKAVITMDLFHATIPALANTKIVFELLGGTTMAQAKALTEP